MSQESPKDPLQERVELVRRTIDELEHLYGPLSRGEDNFERKDDPASDLLLTCDFGGAIIRIRAKLDGTLTVFSDYNKAELIRREFQGRGLWDLKGP